MYPPGGSNNDSKFGVLLWISIDLRALVGLPDKSNVPKSIGTAPIYSGPNTLAAIDIKVP
jgi:hypothetical protein